jgi:hypothetical protein
MSRQCGEHIASKAPDLLHEHLVRQYSAIEADLHIAGAALSAASMIRSVTLGRGAPRHLLGLAFDTGHGEAVKIFAGELGGAAVFRAHIIGRGRGRIASLTLSIRSR